LVRLAARCPLAIEARDMTLDATLDTGLLSGKTIAVIDDHALFLEGLAGLLRSMALDVTVATFQTVWSRIWC
jgi:hypothetical protein